MSKKFITLAAASLLGVFTAAPVIAQTTAPDDANTRRSDPQDGQRRGGGRFDPAQFRQRMLDRMKEQLGASDDEFKALAPKIEKVFQLQRDSSAFGGMGRRAGGGPGGPGGPGLGGEDQPQSPVMEKRHALQQLLDNKDAKPQDIKAKLEDYRAARKQAREELSKAQDDLRGVLTQRQEAALIMVGLLD